MCDGKSKLLTIKQSNQSILIWVMLQAQTILQHFYKLLMWQILTNSNLSNKADNIFLSESIRLGHH